MVSEVTFSDYPYSRMMMRNLCDESDEMKWKILDYHNQDFVLACSIDTRPYTVEGHRKFLQALPNLKRKHYIAYFDGRAVGKFSYEMDGNHVIDSGTFLFHKEDLMTGLGLFFEMFSTRFLFECIKAESYAFNVRKDNTPMLRAMKRIARMTHTDEVSCFFEIRKDEFENIKNKMDTLLPFCLP
ncbi:MAG TPA: hypothetical protein DEP57_02110 [Selenomonas sp.]|nr:hypothetical protein [Selenomonas sp.]